MNVKQILFYLKYATQAISAITKGFEVVTNEWPSLDRNIISKVEKKGNPINVGLDTK